MGVPEPISIHAPLTGCDLRSAHQDSGTSYFNPRTPYGVRRRLPQPSVSIVFISIHAPLAGCDNRERIRLYGVFGISIHAPLAGCDGNRSCASTTTTHFNPRTPYGVRRSPTPPPPRPHEISIHAPLAGCDHPARCSSRQGHHFNPRTPCGVRPW